MIHNPAMNAPAPEKLRRIGLIGDIHCEDQLLEIALRFLGESQVELICAVGDIVDGPGNANRAIELLRRNHVLTVLGNHERWLFAGEMRGLPDANSRFDLDAASWEFLPDLPARRTLETVRGRALLCHGLGDDDMAGVWPDETPLQIHANLQLWRLVQSRNFEFILNGHTHYRMVRTFDNLTVINAGTLYRKHNPCFCIIDFEAGAVQFYSPGFDERVVEAELYHLPLFSRPLATE
ncbi:MAG: metallophosphoesterase family protein [Blastocatellia bacterium]|nr:metallophosphoesterase family protein [Blastocatellia bacterium]